jgi:hypothetical protein
MPIGFKECHALNFFDVHSSREYTVAIEAVLCEICNGHLKRQVNFSVF